MVVLPTILLCNAMGALCCVPAHAHIAQPAGHRPYDSVAQEPLHSEDALGQVQEKSQFYHPQKEIFRDREALAIRAEAG